MRITGGLPSVATGRLAAMSGLVAVALAGGCNDQAPQAKVLPPPPPVVQVTMAEYRFENVAEVRRGRVVVRAHNRGMLGHQLVLVKLPDDLEGTLDQQLHSAERRPVQTLQLMPTVAAGGDAVFAADLAPGRYGFVCFITDAAGQSHALKGMNSELRVR